MHTVEVLRWEPGFMKISHTELLRDTCGLTLVEAKAATDALLEGSVVSVHVATAAEAELLVKRLAKVGAIGRVLPGEHNAA